MFKEVQDREIVLFLGAGFSSSAELPLMKEFGEKAKIENFYLLKHAQADRNSREYRYAAPMLVDSAFVFKKFQEICMRSNTLSDDEIKNLETIFCIAEILKESGQEIISIDGHPYSIDTVIKEIQLWLWKIYQQYPFINDKKKVAQENEPMYNQFFQIIGEPNIIDNITVITTNYDLIFEFKAFTKGMLCSYCIKNSRKINAIWNVQKKYGETFFPSIIPPTYSKLYHHNWLVEIWNNAFVALKNAKKIIFIGYSFPESDGFMRALIHAAMGLRCNEKLPEVYVIDSCKKTHERYKKIFKSMYQKIETQKFFDAVNNGTFKKIFNGC